MRENEQSAKGIEIIVSRVLQAGVVFSSVIILSGLLLFFLNHIGQPQKVSYKEFTSSNYQFPHSVPALIASIKSSSGAGLIGLGVMLLILTPILRVAISILLFVRQRDMPMTIVTLFVLIVLIGSFFVGLAFK